ARLGGLGIIHRNLSIADQAQQVDQVKRSESGMISDPVTISPNASIAELDDICAHYHISGLPVVDDDGTLVGIITNRDIRFIPTEDYPGISVAEKMTRQPLVTAKRGIPNHEVLAIFSQHRVEKLPLVDDEGKLTGLITIKD